MSYDTRNFNRAIDAIVRYSGVPLQTVTDFEAARVLEGAVRRTEAATASSIAESFANTRRPNKRQLIAKAKRARGLAKRAFLALAIKAGLEIRVPGFVRKATPTDGNTYNSNSKVQRVQRKDAYGFDFTTTQPTLEFAEGRRAIYESIGAREKFFRMNMQKGVFTQLKQIAKRYPGMIARKKQKN